MTRHHPEWSWPGWSDMNWYQVTLFQWTTHPTTIWNGLKHSISKWIQIVAIVSHCERNISMKPIQFDCKLDRIHIFRHKWSYNRSYYIEIFSWNSRIAKCSRKTITKETSWFINILNMLIRMLMVISKSNVTFSNEHRSMWY